MKPPLDDEDDLTPPTDWPARTAINPRELRPQHGYTPRLRRRSTACAPTAPSSAALGEWPTHHQICRAARAYPKQLGVSERRLGSVRDQGHRTARAHLHVMRASRKAAARRGQHREAEEASCFKLEITVAFRVYKRVVLFALHCRVFCILQFWAALCYRSLPTTPSKFTASLYTLLVPMLRSSRAIKSERSALLRPRFHVPHISNATPSTEDPQTGTSVDSHGDSYRHFHLEHPRRPFCACAHARAHTRDRIVLDTRRSALCSSSQISVESPRCKSRRVSIPAVRQ